MLKNLIFFSLILTFSCQAQINSNTNAEKQNKMEYKINKSEAEWKEELTPFQFKVLREKGTEQPGTGKYNLHYKEGVYQCAGCNTPLFTSEHKYESHCGWPSFDQAIPNTIVYQEDTSLGRIRTEILCAKCGGHLGHVFDDGPQETTGKRFCVNSESLDFDNKE